MRVDDGRGDGAGDAVDELCVCAHWTARRRGRRVRSEMAGDVGAPFVDVVEGFVAVECVEETGVAGGLGLAGIFTSVL